MGAGFRNFCRKVDRGKEDNPEWIPLHGMLPHHAYSLKLFLTTIEHHYNEGDILTGFMLELLARSFTWKQNQPRKSFWVDLYAGEPLTAEHMRYLNSWREQWEQDSEAFIKRSTR